MKQISKYRQERMEINFWLTEYFSDCNELARIFIQKYFRGVAVGCDGSPEWVCDEPGTVLIVNDFYFGMSDIILALKKEVTIKKLFEWYDYYTEPRKGNGVNFNNWLKGMR
ncbi:MAG TPA: hypothetical protein PKL88_02255 [bacterium]|nr:hypothetical protein [bacterium]